MSTKIQLVTPFNTLTGEALGAHPWEVSKPELWSRSDTELRSSIRKSGSRATGNNRAIKLAAELIGYENVGFRREWK